MPDFQVPRDVEVPMTVRQGSAFMVALDGQPGEAKAVLIGIRDPDHGDVLRVRFTPDRAEDIANNLLELAKIIRDGK